MFITNIYDKLRNTALYLKNNHCEKLIITTLFILFYFIFFHNIGTYSLMDVDETRYVSMARDMFNTKDFWTLYLNGQYFFEKPPLYFWQECLSFFVFGGKINEFSARFPVALLGFVFSFVAYFSVKQWLNRKVAFFTALILATSLEFLILSKYAILDIVLTFYINLALVCYFSTFFCHEKNKKYFWWGTYIFSALAVMAKGIPGFIVPFGTIFFASIITKKFKEIFKPVYILPGIILFLLITLPWHIYMLSEHGDLFYNEYIIKHHLHRFLNTQNNEIGRKQPFYYYILVILWGFIPWIFSLIGAAVVEIKKCFKTKISDKIKNYNFDNLNNIQKVLSLSFISFGWILIFFSLSSTKLATYILPVYFPLAIITGILWKEYSANNKYEKPINISVQIFSWICLIAGILSIFTPLFLPDWLNESISDVRIFVIICFITFGIASLLFLKYKKYMAVFMSYVLFISAISAFGTGNIYKVDYSFGQNDLIEFAQYAKENNYTICANGMSRKYSLLYYNGKKVKYNPDETDITVIKDDLNNKNNVIIIKNKFFDKIDESLDFEIIKQGKRYTMIKGFHK